MAKILTTAIVADIRNKLNGSVFSKNRYGSYVRTKVTPVNPQTTAQQNVRNVLAAFSANWRGLSQAERDSWTNAAPSFPSTDIFGMPKILSGNALYVKLNSNLQNAGASVLTSAPTPGAIPPIASLSVTAAAGTPAVSIVFTPSPVFTDTALKIEATPPIAPGISFVKNRFRVIGYVPAAGTSPYNALTDYNAKFGDPVEGQKIFIRVTVINLLTGQMGIPIQAVAVTAA